MSDDPKKPADDIEKTIDEAKRSHKKEDDLTPEEIDEQIEEEDDGDDDA
jgi:hypothetical protein